MSEQDLRSESQKYLDEMMRFYSQNKNASVNTNEKPPAEQSEPAETDSDNKQSAEPQDNTGEFESTGEDTFKDISDEEANENKKQTSYTPPPDNTTEKEISFESRFPIPVIPDFIKKPSDSKEPEQKEPEQNVSLPAEADEYGFVKVEVRTGENGLPVPGAAVTISQKNDGKDKIIFTGATDQSGELAKMKLPAPGNTKGGTPESFENYSIYTISVYAKDFYREVSVDVPVFSGVTSIQRFNLIPLPFNYNDNGRSMVNRNTEPEI